ncbi:unnamed protein product [Ectocarpus fasciculatus]
MGTSAVVPGTIEAEAFDYGGEGVGYHDTTAGNSGGVRKKQCAVRWALRRTEDVDVKVDGAGGYYIGWVADSEYLTYTVEVTEDADAFDFEFVVASPRGFSGSLQVVSGGTGCSDYKTDLSGVVGITPTGDWDTFATITSSGGGSGGLTEGPNTIWLCTISPGFNIDSFTMTPVAA